MKKIVFATALVASLGASTVFAQAKNFEGFSIGANLNFADSTLELNLPGSSGSASQNNAYLSLQGQYNYALNNSVVLGLGMTYGLGERDAGTLGSASWTNSAALKEKNNFSVYFAPGYAINDSMLAYGKLAYLRTDLNASSSFGSGTTGFNGYGLGLGLQKLFTKNWVGQVEYMYNTYSDNTLDFETQKFKSQALSLGVSYKF